LGWPRSSLPEHHFKAVSEKFKYSTQATVIPKYGRALKSSKNAQVSLLPPGCRHWQATAELEGDWKILPTFFWTQINNGWREISEILFLLFP